MSSESAKVLRNANRAWQTTYEIVKVSEACLTPDEHKRLKREIKKRASESLLVVDNTLDISVDAQAGSQAEFGYDELEMLHGTLSGIEEPTLTDIQVGTIMTAHAAAGDDAAQAKRRGGD